MKYQGYKNRSTWLVKLHLDNTSLEVSTLTKELAIDAPTIKKFKNVIGNVINKTKVSKEVDYNPKDIDYEELWDAYRIN